MSLSPFSTGRGAAVCKGWQSAQSSPRRCLSFLNAELRVHYVGPIPHIQNQVAYTWGYSKNVYIVQKLRSSHNQQGKNHDKTMTIHTYIWVLCNQNKDQSQNICSLYIKKEVVKGRRPALSSSADTQAFRRTHPQKNLLPCSPVL